MQSQIFKIVFKILLKMCLIISTSCCKVSLCNFDSQFSLHTTVYCVYLGLEFTNLERIFCNMFKILSHFYFEPEVPRVLK